ncbi:MAG TPA: hypothetical protein VFA20_35275 [Myxococcaceae bacterium]|nr:hypothetical protein [Myxococcaceae bacterium]
MMLKVKALVAMVAAMSMECVGPMQPPAEVPRNPVGTSRQGLMLEALPQRPPSAPTRGWERGVSTGLGTSGAQSAYVVMYKDPSLNGRFLAFGYDAVGGRSLFVLSVALVDEINFKNQLTIDIGQWKASRATLPSQTGITDGTATTPPPPRPQLDDLMWEHAFYHHSIQAQIEQGQG